MDDPIQPSEFTKGGDPIYRYKEPEKSFTLAIGIPEHIKAITDHIEKYIGKPAWVLHEILSDIVHVDIHVIPPRPDRNYYTLITSGMSQLAMTVPAGSEQWAYNELLLCLPPSWPLRDKDLENENNYWPLRWLRVLARFPHKFKSFLSVFHTIPHGDPPEPIASNTKFIGAMLAPPQLVPANFWRFRIHPELVISFLAVVPLYAEEMDFKLEKGGQKLFERFKKAQVTELLDLHRKNVATTRFGLF